MNKVSLQIRMLSIALLGICLALPAQAQMGGRSTTGSRTGGSTRTSGRTGGSAGSSGSYGNYPSAGQIGSAVVGFDQESRQLFVFADPETGEYISQIVTNIDRPKPQVLIKVVFLELNYNNSLDVGIEGGFTKNIDGSTRSAGANAFGLSGISALASNSSVNPVGLPVANLQPQPPGAGLYSIMGSDYQATLRMIAANGKGKILSRPSILARNNQPATILVGQSVPLVTSVRYDTLGNAINGITYQDIGIILQVTPFIQDDGKVEMIVTPEISALSTTEKVQIQAGAYAPAIDKRRADTVVVTEDGQTVIIGGLIQNTKTETINKIPLLGDIPGLGILFRHKTKADAKTELLIFLTPHIVQTPSELVSLTQTQADRSAALNGPKDKTFSESELNEYLDKVPQRTNQTTVVPAPKK